VVYCRFLFVSTPLQVFWQQRHLASAISLAVLIEKQLDEERAIEKFTFDEMISALGS
jgi:hypothetical protein